MSRVEAPGVRGTWLGRLLHLLNPVMRVLLASPLLGLVSRWFLLLRWKGPKTGRLHAIPVSYVEEGDHAFATTGDSWWHNVVGGRKVDVVVRGEEQPAQVVRLPNRELSASTHERLFRLHPFFRRLAGIPALRSGRPSRAAVRKSIEAGRTLLRIDLGARS
jgi:hypothetical protein